MRLIDRYLVREMIGPAAAALCAFVVLITGHFLFEAVDALAGKGVSLATIVKFAALNAPSAGVLALPVATLLGCALGFNRLASDNELVPVLTAGASGLRLMLPAVILGLAATIGSFVLKEYVVPIADQQAQRMYRRLLVQRKALVFEPGEFVEAGSRWVFIARDVDAQGDTLYGLWGLMKRPEGFPWLVSMDKAQFRREQLRSADARFYAFSPPETLNTLRGDLSVNLSELSRHEFSGQRMENRTLRELWRQRRPAAAGNRARAREYSMEIHSRLSLITACLAFSLLAVPIVWRFGHGQSLTGVVATLVIGFVYYVIMLGLRILGNNGILPVVVAAWGQNAIIVVGALWAMRRL